MDSLMERFTRLTQETINNFGYLATFNSQTLEKADMDQLISKYDDFARALRELVSYLKSLEKKPHTPII